MLVEVMGRDAGWIAFARWYRRWIERDLLPEILRLPSSASAKHPQASFAAGDDHQRGVAEGIHVPKDLPADFIEWNRTPRRGAVSHLIGEAVNTHTWTQKWVTAIVISSAAVRHRRLTGADSFASLPSR